MVLSKNSIVRAEGMIVSIQNYCQVIPMISFKGSHFNKEMILQSVRWYLAYALSYRDTEEIMKERVLDVDHSTLNRWVVKYSPQLEAVF